MWKIAVLFGVVEAVADHEPIVNREADVLDGDIHLPARGLAEQTRRAKRLGVPGPEDVLQVGQCQARIHDVFDDDDIAAVERGVEILEHPDLAGARPGLRIARNRHEIERHRAVHVPDQVGEKHEGALQNSHQVHVVRGVAPDFSRQLGDPFLNLLLRE